MAQINGTVYRALPRRADGSENAGSAARSAGFSPADFCGQTGGLNPPAEVQNSRTVV